MAAKTALTVTVHIDGINETLAAFRRLPKEANQSLRDRTLRLSKSIAAAAKANAAADDGPQTHLLIPTIRAARDRVPVVQAGGGRRVGSNRAPAWKLLFGSEFGSNEYEQFQRPHGGQQGYWFFPTVEENETQIAAAWQRIADDILTDFGRP